MQVLNYIPANFFEDFNTQTSNDLGNCFANLKQKEFTKEDFKNYMSASAVASSQIEGSTMDLNSFFVAKQNKINNKEVKEIDNLIKAYKYAKANPLTLKNLLHCHKIIAASFTNVTAKQKGNFRQIQLGIRSNNGLVYLAVEPQFVEAEIAKLFADIEILLHTKLTNKQVLYYAAFIHFLFVKIHPFADGNGRVARLLEKWFLAQKLDAIAWGIPAENYYWQHRGNYYKHLNVGVNYYETLERLQNTTPFLLMLQNAVCYTPTF
jgi:Fic family protein